MLISVLSGLTGVIVRLKFRSTSGGVALTGLTGASSGLIISTAADNEAAATSYTAAGSTIGAVATLGTYAAPTAGQCNIKEYDSTNHKGVYEVHFANARYAVSGARSLLISWNGATGMLDGEALIPLIGVDPSAAIVPANTTKIGGQTASAAAPVSFPAVVGSSVYAGGAVASVTAGVTLASTQAYNNTGQSANLPANVAQIGGQTASAAAPVSFPTSVGSSVFAGGAVASVTAPVTLASTQAYNNTAQTSNLPANVAQIGGQAASAAAPVSFPTSVGSSTFAGGAVASVTAAVTVGTNNDKTGYGLSSAERTSLSGVIMTDSADLLGADIVSIKATIGVAGAGLTAIPGGGGGSGVTLAQLTATIPTLNVLGTINPVVAGTVSDKAGYALSATGLNTVAGWGTFTLPQTVRGLFAFLAGKRSGVPASGVGGSPTFVDNAALSYGSVTVDASGNITASALTPP